MGPPVDDVFLLDSPDLPVQAAQKGLEQAIEAARVPDLLEALRVAEGR